MFDGVSGDRVHRSAARSQGVADHVGKQNSGKTQAHPFHVARSQFAHTCYIRPGAQNPTMAALNSHLG